MGFESPAFLSQKAPPGYIAGIGRGATGFTTRSDVGSGKQPGRQRDDREAALDGGSHDVEEDAEENDGRRIRQKGRFDDSNGLSLNSAPIVSSRINHDDAEADRIYSEIDAQLSGRKALKKADVNRGSEKVASTGLEPVSHTFVDLKRSLSTVSEEQWNLLPEAGDFTKRNKRQRLELQNERKSYAAPDALISGNIDLSKLTQQREKLLNRQLDENLNVKNSNDALEDSEKLLRELDDAAKDVDLQNELQDIGRMRIILNSYRKSDPKKPQGWIASARLEERARKFRTAKSLIDQGCDQCPRDEDIWLENIRLNSSDLKLSKILVAQALSFNEESLKLWLKAVELELETLNKKRVIRKAIQSLPRSPELWKLAVRYEDNKAEAIKILQKAMELMPHNIELLVALVNLQDHASARKTLNIARQQNPGEVQIWILASELEERSGDIPLEKLTKLLKKGLKELADHDTILSFAEWLQVARRIEAEFANLYKKTVQAVVKVAMENTYADTDHTDTIVIIDKIEQQCYTKCCAYKFILEKQPHKLSIWNKFVDLCRAESIMPEAYQAFEDVLFSADCKPLLELPVLVLMFSKLIWKYDNNTSKALDILDRSISKNPNYVDFWLAKSKLLLMDEQFEKAESLFKDALKKLKGESGFERVCHRFLSFLRYQGRTSEALKFLENSFLDLVPDCEKLLLQWGQMYIELQQPQKARECFAKGTQKLPQSAKLWIELSHVDNNLLSQPIRARSNFDLAQLNVPAGPQLELLQVARIQMEKNLGNLDQARLLVAQGLKSSPTSAALWAENLDLIAKKSAKKTAYQDALKSTKSDHRVLISIGMDLFTDSHYEKALKWFERATTAAPLYGDGWIWLSRCYKRTNRQLGPLFRQVDEIEPRYGSEWAATAKKVANLCQKPSQVLSQCLK
ncbi:LADA_0B06986g1_1 [Lachancea dasiensis]|uniref:LADA_0B06986g1_1 n=1 Tax=Lachancea dasiensis TaxID=1072105 RepID=A0A1G4ITQ4_9SACH|nr:LADA_0B06986g1_1 [Lachancea dasiensis]